MKKRLYCILASFLLCSCSGAPSSSDDLSLASSDVSETAVSNASVSSSLPPESLADSSVSSAPTKKTETVKADLIRYENDRLTVETDGEEQTYEVWDNVFSGLGGADKARLIINNRYGEKIPASIRFDSEKKRIVSCELKIKLFTGFNDPESIRLSGDDKLMQMEKTDNKKIRFYNKDKMIEADIRDLSTIFWGKYPDSFTDVITTGYILPSGTYLAEQIGLYSETDEMGNKNYSFCDLTSYYGFFGTVKSLSDDRATVLLTDGKTTCDVPTYFNDGDLKEGMDVMLVLDADTSLFGSGQSFKDDYAVFYTEPVSLLLKGKKDITLFAYAKCSETQYGKFDCVEISELGTSAAN